MGVVWAMAEAVAGKPFRLRASCAGIGSGVMSWVSQSPAGGMLGWVAAVMAAVV